MWRHLHYLESKYTVTNWIADFWIRNHVSTGLFSAWYSRHDAFSKTGYFPFFGPFCLIFFKLAFLSDFLLVVWTPNIFSQDLFPPSKCRTSVVFEYALYCWVGKMNVQNECPWKSTKLFAKAGNFFLLSECNCLQTNIVVLILFRTMPVVYFDHAFVCMVENNEKQ